ncbi:NrdH-redoxin [Virgibacillus profundi]|uniref:NrdH-redoxin n=1 Tax=Virgibacillus profundi TaxID=2024555 RepID=A0A2A2IG07_9BACI|nr:NrdH-redoxin [Virgibacillus profundi]PAV30699.1 NrdH-redoxin [Virgibacillus profundi]PXY54871.1 NrdH-redoxin [Virgibacillus profundi]
MSERSVIIYISESNSQCKKLIDQMDKWEIPYKTKNVTENNKYMKDLQQQGIFGTPATFIESEQDPILGFQKNKIKYALGIENYKL